MNISEEATAEVSGFDILNPSISRALQESFNITKPTPIQAEAIPELLKSAIECGDLVLQAQTGSGKTLAYALPLLQRILETFKPKNTTNAPAADSKDENGKEAPNWSTVFREEIGTVGLVIVPTRELAVQTQATLTKLLNRIRPHWIVTTALTGGDSRKSEKARLRRGCQIVIGTPGRLLDHLKTSEGWKRSKLSWLVVDEADRLADLGFEANIKEIFATLSMAMARLQIILLSATVTEKLKVEFAGRKLRNPKFIKAGPKKEVYCDTQVANNNNEVSAAAPLEDSTKESFLAPVMIDQSYLHVPTKLRLLVLVGLLRSFFPITATSKNSRVIVFFTCCDSVDFHFDLFQAAAQNKSIPALLPPRVKLLRLHGNLDQKLRVSTFNEFIREGKTASGAEPIHTILFCTDVAARGLDFPNLSGSVQYDAPCDIHDYIHRAGRTGRLSAASVAQSESEEFTPVQKARSVIFLMPSEEQYVQRLTNMGMTTLKKTSFDEFLKWVEKLDAKRLQSLLGKSKKAKKKLNNKKDSDESSTTEESAILALPSTLKARLNLLQQVIEAGIDDNEDLSFKARDGFLSTVRAYATHPSSEKDIFHVKRLHLGHLAASFGLDREPKRMLDGHARRNQQQNRLKSNAADIPAEIAAGSSKMRKEMRSNVKFNTQNEPHQNRLNFESQKRSYPKEDTRSHTHSQDNDYDDDEPVKFAY